jgi:hypothetical protein
MTITINEQPVEFSLDDETTFGDLLASLQLWAQSQDSTLLGALADGKAADPDLALDRVGRVDVEVVSNAERDDVQTTVVVQYLDEVARAAEAGNRAALEAWASEWPSVRSRLSDLVGTGPGVDGPTALLDLPWDESVASPARILAAEARRFQAEKTKPEAVVARVLEELDAWTQVQRNLAALFQKGQDAEAFGLLVGLFTAWETLGRVVPTVLVRQGKSVAGWAAVQADLGPFFKEIEAALRAQDYILVTDLLEYEVSPRLQGLRSLF